ncbi:hypothetical protein KPH14_008894 [Odynerus spinipes]|uniref:Nucleic-acid-binding protein from transposon X-element n=1 Tax=Odynerus spinipes TaxID=1348599 RepID=A0AAD9RNL7_9HYME|nr:hypothetical protein KPH14_008894 [Odynerus spinipes]
MAANAKRKHDAPHMKGATSKITKRTTLTTETLENSYKKMIKEFGSQTTKNKNLRCNPTPNLTKSRERVFEYKDAQQPSTSQSETDAEGWETPKKIGKPDRLIGTAATLFAKTNSFERLEDLEDTDTMELDENSENKLENYSDKNNNRNSCKDNGVKSTNKDNIPKSTRPPPIHITNVDIRETINLLTSNNINKGEFRLKQLNGPDSTLTVYAGNISSYEKIIEILLLNKKLYYTYTVRSKKPKSLVLKGVNGGYTAEMVREEIESLNLENLKIEKVSEVTFNKNSPRKATHFLVQISQDSTVTELMKTKVFFYQVVKWEYLRKGKIFQCKRCQRLGHASSNCMLPYRCVKCGGDHGPNACKITTTQQKENLKCANCGQNGHPASYKGCIYYKHALSMINSNKNIKKQENHATIQRISRAVNANISYAAITSQQTNPSTHAQHKTEQTTWKTPYIGTQAYPIEPHINNNIPSWVNDLKNEFKTISNRLISLETLIANNSSRIDQLFEAIGEQIVYE